LPSTIYRPAAHVAVTFENANGQIAILGIPNQVVVGAGFPFLQN